jgi:hypothetical protein
MTKVSISETMYYGRDYMTRYSFSVAMLAIASVLLFGAFMEADGVEIVLEAELAQKIQAPMVVGVSEDAKGQGGIEPREASNDKFIWMAGAPATDGLGRGFAEFSVHIPEDGIYAIWGRVIAWDINSDSFWVTWEPADPAEKPQETNNFQFRWLVAQGAKWHWDRINHWVKNVGDFDKEWELDEGKTKLTIWVREDATMLDCLFITSDLAPNEGAVGPREPTDADRKLQLQNAGSEAIEATGKLSTMWGSIRSEYHY